MMENGYMDKEMELDYKNGLMEVSIKDSGLKIKDKDKVYKQMVMHYIYQNYMYMKENF